MKFDVDPETLVTWAGALGDDPALLRQLAGLARAFGSQAGTAAHDTPDLAGAAADAATRFDTVLSTVADALDSWRTRVLRGSGAYAATECTVRAAVGASRG